MLAVRASGVFVQIIGRDKSGANLKSTGRARPRGYSHCGQLPSSLKGKGANCNIEGEFLVSCSPLYHIVCWTLKSGALRSMALENVIISSVCGAVMQHTYSTQWHLPTAAPVTSQCLCGYKRAVLRTPYVCMLMYI